jgi:hypothetical protein
MCNDLGQDCQGLWHCWRHGQCCVPIDSVGGSAQEPVNLEDTEEHDAPNVRILSACLLFCQLNSRIRQAEVKVFIIMCATQELSV